MSIKPFEDRVLDLAEKIKAGDTIIYAKFTGDEVEFEDKKYLIVSKADILAVIR